MRGWRGHNFSAWQLSSNEGEVTISAIDKFAAHGPEGTGLSQDPEAYNNERSGPQRE